jgi:hypothetical protein
MTSQSCPSCCARNSAASDSFLKCEGNIGHSGCVWPKVCGWKRRKTYADYNFADYCPHSDWCVGGYSANNWYTKQWRWRSRHAGEQVRSTSKRTKFRRPIQWDRTGSIQRDHPGYEQDSWITWQQIGTARTETVEEPVKRVMTKSVGTVPPQRRRHRWFGVSG